MISNGSPSAERIAMTNPKSLTSVTKVRRAKILKRSPFGDLKSELSRNAQAFEALTTLVPLMPNVFDNNCASELIENVCELSDVMTKFGDKLDTLLRDLRKIYGHEIKPILVEFDAKEFGEVDYVEDDALFVNLVYRAIDIGGVVGMARLVIIVARLRSVLNSRKSKLEKLAYRSTRGGSVAETETAKMAEEKMAVVIEQLEKRVKFCCDKFLELHGDYQKRSQALMDKFKQALTK